MRNKNITLVYCILFAFATNAQIIDQDAGNVSGFNRIKTGTGDWMDIQLEGTGSSFKIHDNTNHENWVRWEAGSDYTEFLKNLVLTSSRLGIGVNIPSSPLTIKSISQYSDGGIRLLGLQSNDVIAYISGADYGALSLSDVNSSQSVRLSSNGDSYFTGGRLGIGVVSPSSALTIKSISQYSDGGFRLLSKNSDDIIAYITGGTYGAMSLSDNNSTQSVRLSANGDSYITGGDFGIGTNQPDEKLTVKGTVHAQEVRVDLSGAVAPPDYVFEESYPLASLDEIKAYITKNKHLPEVPSAKEMEANGIELGEMNMLLLKKIEELTLHQIELMELLKKEREITDQKILELQKESTELRSELEIIKAK